MTLRSRLSALTALAALAAAAPALAHPHVWVTVKAEIAYAPDGRLTGVRHAWTFDPAYSAFVTQGLDRNGDGKLTPDELAELAKVNTESLVDFEYFTFLKADGAKQAFDAPREPAMAFDQGQATLTFLLPLKTPAQARKAVALEVYDPTYFVAFGLAEGEDAVRLAGAPKGCALTLARPKPVDAAQQQKLGEAFFEALTAASTFGSSFANRAIVACP
jgi:ABC-type uncharacterized transport system substrate-binding protein